jgi:hypothetical protein
MTPGPPPPKAPAMYRFSGIRVQGLEFWVTTITIDRREVSIAMEVFTMVEQ